MKNILFLLATGLLFACHQPEVKAETDIGIDETVLRDFGFETFKVSEFEPVLTSFIITRPICGDFPVEKSPGLITRNVRIDRTKEYVSTRIRNNVFGLIITYTPKSPKKNKGKPTIRFL